MDKKTLERFLSKVVKTEACWVWCGSLDGHGYAQFDGRTASRVSYEHFVRPIPPLPGSHHGFCVCHVCDNPLCVFPDHLFIAPQWVNLRDAQFKGRLAGKNQKLSAEVVRGLREEYARGGVSQKELAERVGCSQAYVSRVLRGRRRAILVDDPGVFMAVAERARR